MDQSEFSAHLEEMERVAARQKATRLIDHQSVGICLNCGVKGITYHEETAILIDGKVITSRNGQRLQCPHDGGEGDTYNLIHQKQVQ